MLIEELEGKVCQQFVTPHDLEAMGFSDCHLYADIYTTGTVTIAHGTEYCTTNL